MASHEDQATPLRDAKGRPQSRVSQTDPHKLRSTKQDNRNDAPNTVGRGDLTEAHDRMFSGRRSEAGHLNIDLITGLDPTTPQSAYVPDSHESSESSESSRTSRRLPVDRVVPSFKDFTPEGVGRDFGEHSVPLNPSTPHVKKGSKNGPPFQQDLSTYENHQTPAPGETAVSEESHVARSNPNVTNDDPPVGEVDTSTPIAHRVSEPINSPTPRSNSSSIIPHIWVFLGAVLWAASLGWFISVSIGNNETRYLYHVFQVFFGGFFATGMFRVIKEKDEQSSDMTQLSWGFLHPRTTLLFSLLSQPVLLHEIIFHLVKDQLFSYVHGEAVTTIKQIETETVIDITSVVHIFLAPLLVYVLCVSNAASFYLLDEKSLFEAIKEGHALFKRSSIRLALLTAINQIRTILPYTAAVILGSLGFKLPNGNEQMNEVVALMTLVIIAMPVSIPFVYQDFKKISARE